MTTPHYILAGWLIDGSGRPIERNVLLTIQDGIFTGIEEYRDRDGSLPGPLVDLSHCTVLPVLIDSHVHLAMSGSTDELSRSRQLTAGYGQLRHVIKEHIAHHYSHGVFAVRDGGDRQGSALQFKNSPDFEDCEPVIIKAAGRAWHQRGRYGGLIGRHPADGVPLGEAYARDSGPADFVKLVNSGMNSLVHFGRQTPAQFSPEELRSVVAQAKEQNRRVMVHANGRVPVQMAIEAGCHSIEHGYFMGAENLELMAEKGVFWVPTLYAMKACTEHATGSDMRGTQKVAEKNLAHQLEQVALARRAGVKIALGTDAGSIGVLHGEAVVEELKLLMQAGCSLVEAMSSATSHGASLLGLEQELGVIAKEKPAHFLVARGTPAQLPRKLSYLEAIYRDGRPCPFYKR